MRELTSNKIVSLRRLAHAASSQVRLSLPVSIWLGLFCLVAAVSGNAQTPKPSPQATPRRPLPKLSSGARGFDFNKDSKDGSTRLIAVGGGWGAEEGKPPRLRGQTARAYFDLGRKYSEQLEFAKAIPPLAKAIKLNPNYLAAYEALGEAYAYDGVSSTYEAKDKDRAARFQQERYRQAIGAFEPALRLAPTKTDLHFNLGVLYFNTGQYQKAVDSFRQGLRLGPLAKLRIPIMEASTLTDVYGFIGEALEYLGQRDDALKSYQKALAIDPDENKTGIYQKLGNLYEEMGELDKALDAYSNSVSKEGAYVSDAEMLLRIGEIHAVKQDYEEAAATFAKVKDMYQKDLTTYRQSLANDTGATADIKKYWKEEVSLLQAQLAQVDYNIGVSRLSLNQPEQAVASFKEAVELDEKNASAQFNLGIAYLAVGNQEAARTQAQILRGLDPELAKELEVLINR